MNSAWLSSFVLNRMRAWLPALALLCTAWHDASGAAERRYFAFSPFAGTAQFGSADGFRTDARFQQPLGIAQKADGAVFIVDGALATVRRVTTDGMVSVFAGESGRVGGLDGVGAAARFSSPRAVVPDGHGNLIVADGSSIRRITAAGEVTTVAGRYLEEGLVDGPGEAARFRGPAGLAIDAAGNIWVADKYNHAIRRIDPRGVVVTVVGMSGEAGAADGTMALARFTYPEAIAVDRAGNVFVGDQTHTVRRIAGDMVSTVAGKSRELGAADGPGSSARFFGIAGFAFGADGNLYISDSGNRSIRKMTPLGVVSTLAGGRGYGTKDGPGADARFGGNFSGTQGLVVGRDGEVLVCDSPNGTIRAIAGDGTVSTWAGVRWLVHDGTGVSARFSGSGAIATVVGGISYLADREAHAVRMIDATGRVSTIAGGYGESGYRDGLALEARFNRPSGITAAPDGTIYIADTFNQVIRRIKDGLATTVAGRVGVSGNADGRSADARFFQPEAILVDPDGSLLIADTFNHTIRRLSSDGVVSTVAGQAGELGFLDGFGGQARFNQPCALAFAKNGDILVADMNNCAVRVVTRQGQVTTLVGRPDFLGRDGDLQTARIGAPTSLAVDDAGIIYVADALRAALREILPDGRVVTVDQSVAPQKIAFDTNGRLLVSSGNRDVVVGRPAHSRLANLSVRAMAEPNGTPLIAGFFVGGDSAPADLLIRAVGPGLRVFGVTAAADNPRLSILGRVCKISF